jgi:hypothetical protein
MGDKEASLAYCTIVLDQELGRGAVRQANVRYSRLLL